MPLRGLPSRCKIRLRKDAASYRTVYFSGNFQAVVMSSLVDIMR